MIDEDEIHMALRARLEAIAELPAYKAWENVGAKPPLSADHIDEQFVPAPGRVTSFPIAHGDVETPGLYVIGVYGLTDKGDAAIRAITSAIKTAFPPGLSETLSSGVRLFIRSNPTPWASQILPFSANKSRSVVTVPWDAQSINSIPSA